MTNTDLKKVDGKSEMDTTDDKEQQWQQQLAVLQAELDAYKKAKLDGDEQRKEEAEKNIPKFMRRAGAMHPDPDVTKKMEKDADEFEKADDKGKELMLHPLVVGIGLLLVTPFALVGAALVAAGGIVYGAAKVVEGVGKGLAAGPEYLYSWWKSRT